MKKLDFIRSSLLLAAVGDSIGYKNGCFEFERNGKSILEDVKELGGLSNIDLKNWIVSDDTVMHIATAKAIANPKDANSLDEIMTQMAEEYILCWSDMSGRAPGGTCGFGIRQLRKVKWNQIQYNDRGGGCGASMRAMCIGLKYYGKDNRDMLIAVSIESGRLTHNHPTGFLGALVSAVFTAFAMEKIEPIKWGYLLINEILPLTKIYLRDKSKRDWDKIDGDLDYFEGHFKKFMKDRQIVKGEGKPYHPQNFIDDVDERYKYWAGEYSFSGWPGGSGDDSVIIAYDCILLCGDSYDDIVRYSCWHGGDSDSTGTIALAWWGALYGLKGVYDINLKNLEKKEELEKLADDICNADDDEEKIKKFEEKLKTKEENGENSSDKEKSEKKEEPAEEEDGEMEKMEDQEENKIKELEDKN